MGTIWNYCKQCRLKCKVHCIMLHLEKIKRHVRYFVSSRSTRPTGSYMFLPHYPEDLCHLPKYLISPDPNSCSQVIGPRIPTDLHCEALNVFKRQTWEHFRGDGVLSGCRVFVTQNWPPTPFRANPSHPSRLLPEAMRAPALRYRFLPVRCNWCLVVLQEFFAVLPHSPAHWLGPIPITIPPDTTDIPLIFHSFYSSFSHYHSHFMGRGRTACRFTVVRRMHAADCPPSVGQINAM